MTDRAEFEQKLVILESYFISIMQYALQPRGDTHCVMESCRDILLDELEKMDG
jgi:hypothetical protein